MMKLIAKDIPVGVDFIHVDPDGWKTTHHLIRKTIYPDYIELNQYKYALDDIIEVVRFDDQKDEKIAEQAKQIATLKAALIADREELIVNGSSYVIWRYQNNIDPIDPNWGLIKSHAKEELAQEYPDIDWEE